MKTTKLFIIAVGIGSCILFISDCFSQVAWRISLFDQKVFIENKGQFDRKNGNESTKILFGTSSEGIELYFTSKGLTYRHDELVPMTEEELKQQTVSGTKAPAKEERKMMKSIPRYLSIEWVGSNPNAEIITEESVSFYYTYGGAGKDANTTIKANACKKIIYKNIYPHIDVEYVFPSDSSGIKYSFILHPGANPAVIKMKYENAKNISFDSDGNMVIKSFFGEFIDHAPKTFYQDNKSAINSSFVLSGNEISFNIKNYNKNKTIIIDPWVVNPAFTNDNKAFDIAKDAIGNVYVYGGGGAGSPWQLKKFDASGNPIWTYTTTYTDWYGDLAVDAAGNSYISEGCCGGGIQKIDPTGAVLWNVNYGVYEFWCLAFNCTFTNLYVGCGYSAGSVTPYNSIADINLNTGAISGGTALNSGGAEPRAIAWGPNGNIYFMSCSPPGDMVFGVTPAFANIFSVASGYTLQYNGPGYANSPSSPTSGQNGIAANNRFVYTSDGAILNKRDVLNGTLISSVIIPGGITENNSGIIIDDCGFVYAGSSNGVYKYDSLLTFISSVPTTGAVYCLYPGANGEVLASGNGFIASLNLSYCTINLNTTSTGVNCNVPNSGTASVTVSGGSIPYTYLWSDGQTTQTATGLAAGNYTVTVTDASGCKQSSATVTVTGGSALSTTITATPATCNNNNGSATMNVTGGTSPYTYTWSPSGGTNATATGLSAGNYTVTVTDANNCTATQTVTITQPTAITATVIPTSATCGNNNGSAVSSASGGILPYTYLWSNSQTGSTATGLATGTYTVTITDANGCTATQTVIVTSIPGPTANAFSNATITQGQSITLTASGGGTYSWSNGATGSSITVTPPATTLYCVTVTDANNCTDTACVTVTVEPDCSNAVELYLPNAFSPNGDGENDKLQIYYGDIQCIESIKLIIYNRWGEKVFESTDPNFKWDGSFRGKIMNTSVLVYYLKAKMTDGTFINKKGNVSLVR